MLRGVDGHAGRRSASLKLLAAVVAALVIGALTVAPAFAATRATSPPPGSDLSQQLSTLQRKLAEQQASINSLADREESERASVKALNAKVAVDRQREHAADQQLDRVARIEYERPALTLTTVLDARNLGELLSGIAQARVISHQQQQLFRAARAARAGDQRDQAAAQWELDRISKQQAEATAIAATTRSEISTLLAEQAAAQQAAQKPQTAQRPASQPQSPSQAPASSLAAPQQPASAPITAAASITLKPGPSDPNRFYVGQCTWYVATIYSIPWLGNADQWPAAAAADGQAEGSTPVVGAIMESADSAFGHVSVVISVTDDNDWTVREMNYAGGPGVIDTRHVTRATSNLVTFIY